MGRRPRPGEPDETDSLAELSARVAQLENKIQRRKWWKDHGWWAVIVATAVLAWQTKPWELLQDDAPVKRVGTVELIDGHASAFAKNEWDADLRVVNRTSRDIVVERVTAVFGARKYGHSCRDSGRATRVLYPVSQLRTRSPLNLFQRIHPGEGAPFKGGPNVDRLFGGKRPCPLPVGKLHSPRDTVTFTVFANDGSEWTSKRKLFYEPRARISGGGGGGLCFPFPFC